MGFDFHPFLAHFPVALLTVYAVLELLRFKALISLPYWFYVKGAILFLGVGFGALTLQSGEFIEHAYDGTPLGALVDTHSAWGEATINIFGLLAVLYAVRWLEQYHPEQYFSRYSRWHNVLSGGWQVVTKINGMILDGKLVLAAAAAGLIAVSIAGALGGAIVYGPAKDPALYFVYKLFF